MMSRIDHTAAQGPLRLPRETWRAIRTRLIFIYDHAVDMVGGGGQGYSRPPNYALWLLRAGGVVLRPDAGPTVQARAGQWVALPDSMGRRQQFEEGSALLSVHFTAEWPDGRPLLEFDRPIVAQYAAWHGLEPVLTTLLRITDALPAHSTYAEEAQFDGALRAFLIEWHGCLCRSGASETAPFTPDPRLAAAIDVLEHAPFTGSIPYAELCAASNLSRVHLNRLFRRQMNKSPRQYLQQRVYDRVCEALARGTDSAKEIAFDAGFTTTSHFTQWFRRRSGMTPGRYRASAALSSFSA